MAIAVEDILPPERVLCEAECGGKKRALEIIAGLITEAEQDALCEKLNERERLGSTGIGEGVAIPHTRLSSAEGPRAALLTLRQPIDFAAIDDQPVDILFALVVPDDAPDEHLALLGHLAGMFSQERVRERLRNCHSGEELRGTFIAAWQDA